MPAINSLKKRTPPQHNIYCLTPLFMYKIGIFQYNARNSPKS